MQNPFLALNRALPWHVAKVAGAGLIAVALLVIPIRAQDDGGAPPPAPTDNGAQAQGDGGQDPASGGADTGQDGASFQTFYDSLSNQGTWIQSSDYGYVWQPQVSDPAWAPYTLGHWVYTDDGWTWASDESFGWATYHYGRWVNLDGTGWVWVPGYTWGPAWVSWRYGDGYAGWAPLPPDSFAGIDYFGDGFDADSGFHIGGDCDGFYGIGAALYIFLPVNCLCYHDYHHWYRNRGDNFDLINRTTNVTNINVTRNHGNTSAFGDGRLRHVTTGGPQLAQVNAVSPTPIPHVNLVRSNQPGGGTLTQNSLALYAPRVRPTEGAIQPARVNGTLGPLRINRGTDIQQFPAVNAHLAPPPASAEQVQAARLAQDHAPAGAKVLTDASAVKPVIPGPLLSLKPISRGTAVGASGAPASNPGAIYNNAGAHPVYGPVHMPPHSAVTTTPPREEIPPSHIYGPAPPVTTPPHYSPTSAGSSETEPRTYTPTPHPAPASSAPAAPASRGSAPSGGGSSGSSGGGGRGSGGSGPGNH
jgi:hypothetical protein